MDATASVPLKDGAAKVRVGTCAWSFDDWRGVFYSAHLPSAQRLPFYARHFDTVEIDSTFYAAPSLHAVGHWLDVTPEDFLFAAKAPRELTHERKLRESGPILTAFLSAMAPLRRKLGCVLVQLPPYFTVKQDEHALREFVLGLPRDFRFAIEFRDPSWHLPRIAHLLEEHRVCWVWNDVSAVDHAEEGAFDSLPRTTDFLYVRLLGDLETTYRSDGSRAHTYRRLLWPRDASLETWAIRVGQQLGEVGRAFVFANNHFEGFSPETCQRLGAHFGRAISLPTAEELAGRTPEDARQLELL